MTGSLDRSPADDKRFNEWDKRKKEAHYANILPIYNEREIWWLMIGEIVRGIPTHMQLPSTTSL